MKKLILLFMFFAAAAYSQSLAPVQSVFMQGNNINTVFMTNGILNYDKVTFSGSTAGFVWPAAAPQRLTAVYASGLWIGAKVGPERDLRVACSFFDSHYSPGNIPVIGGVPPSSVCSDPSWRAYQVQLTDPSLFNGGTRYKTAGGRQYTSIMTPGITGPLQKAHPMLKLMAFPGISLNGMVTDPE